MKRHHAKEKIAAPKLTACILLFGLLLLGSSTSATGQVALASEGRYDLMTFGVGASSLGLPIFACIEQTLDDSKSYGAIASFRSYAAPVNGTIQTGNYLGLALRGDYHVDLEVDGLDLFIGLNAGLYANLSPDAGAINPGFGGQVGARYAWKDLHFFLQLGGGNMATGALLGLSFPL